MKKLLSVLVSTVVFFCTLVPTAHCDQIPRIDGNLPEGVSVEEFINLLVSKQAAKSVPFVQIRKWRGNKYVMMLCVVNNKNRVDASESEKGDCGNKNFDIYIGVISFKEQKYTLEYHTNSPILMNENVMDYDSYSIKLDLAPYTVNEKTTAIGLRRSYLTWNTGEDNHEEYLLLLIPHERKLIEIFSLGVNSTEVSKGELHPDGMRDRFGYGNKSTVQALKTKTNGFYDYLVKTEQYEYEGRETKKSIKKDYYVWSQEKMQYVLK